MNKGNVIEIRCNKCNKLMMEYFVCGDDSAVALQNIGIKCDRCVRFKSGYIPGESEIREAMDRAMIMQLNLLPVARKMVLEELEMKQNG